MGIDNRGVLRKECLVKNCDYVEYENVSVEGCYNCAYCGCPPAKHKQVDETNNPKSSFTADPKESQAAPTGLLANCPPQIK